MHFHLGARIIYSVTFYISFWLSACNHYGVNGWSRAGHQEGSSGLSLIIWVFWNLFPCSVILQTRRGKWIFEICGGCPKVLAHMVELCLQVGKGVVVHYLRAPEAEAAAPGYCWSTAKAPAPWYHPPPAEEPVSKNELPAPVYYRACYLVVKLSAVIIAN